MVKSTSGVGLLGGGSITVPTYTPDLETTLRTELFTDYEVLQRPSKQVDVNVSLTVLTVNELKWLDDRLVWSNSSLTSQNYGSVPFLFSTEKYVWRPAVIIENSVEDISVISDENIPMRMQSSGVITWNPSGIYKVSCEPDITYYPMDSQTCTIKVTTWSYTAKEIHLNFDGDSSVNLGFYSENGEWELLYASSQVGDDKSIGGEDFSSLEFILHLRRRPLFHILNTLFPVTLMAVLIAMVFRLPANSGEKIGFSLTVLLAYAVYLTLISDNIPSTSMTVCFLSKYYKVVTSFLLLTTLTLGLGTISVICTIIVLEVYHHTEDDEIPPWLQRLSRDCLAYLVCWKKKSCCSSRKRVRPETQQDFNKIYVKEKPPISQDEVVSEYNELPNTDNLVTWQDIAAILDKFFFASYMVIILISSLVLWSLVVVHYINN
ncbi:hypothetical protein KUTeg_012955 [Tegillarca granosa]|uniref:Uncharacterized protein n=1 Tax=Tegillarca granosa TaxID=220873 RepID=A0ABQ9EVT1_TEGGR|nr:hypothetical protein KUTeg_012955 [Tegillarca granosa]